MFSVVAVMMVPTSTIIMMKVYMTLRMAAKISCTLELNQKHATVNKAAGTMAKIYASTRVNLNTSLTAPGRKRKTKTINKCNKNKLDGLSVNQAVKTVPDHSFSVKKIYIRV